MSILRLKATFWAFAATVSLSSMVWITHPQTMFAEEGNGNSPADTADSDQQRLERIRERVERSGLVLEETRRNYLLQKCQGAQGKVTTAQNRFRTLSINRLQVYNAISSRLNLLEINLQNRGADITQISQDLAAFNLKISLLSAAFDNFERDLEDLAAMDCVSDPAGFQATLAEARETLASIQTQIQQLRQFLVEDLWTSFAAAYDALTTDTTETQIDLETEG